MAFINGREVLFSANVHIDGDGDYQAGYEAGHTTGYNEGHGAGYKDGYDLGYIDGEIDGKASGRSEGYTEGYTEGYEDAKIEHYDLGYNAGMTAGYADGFAKGKSAGIELGIEQGKKAEYDARWNNIQQNGNRIGGYMLFAGVGWNSENYKPKHKVAIGAEAGKTYSASMFERFDNLQAYAPLEINEGDIDFSRATQLVYTFRNANVAKVEMDCIPPNLTKMTSTFTMNSINSSKLTTLKLGVNANTTYDDLCFRITTLENLSFIEGSIIGNTVTFSYSSKLKKQSITNIVNALSTTTSGLKVTLSLTAVNKAFETSSGANDGSNSAEWSALESTKTNWTISLV